MLSYVIAFEEILCNVRESNTSELSEWRTIFRTNLSFAKKFYNTLTPEQRFSLKTISRNFRLTLFGGELRLIEGRWYVTHAGLIGLARGIAARHSRSDPRRGFCDACGIALGIQGNSI